MPDKKSESQVLIMTGMHRSGTSLTASLLQSAGLHVGRRLMQGTEFNPKGYFENIDFFEFHLDLLRSQGVNIDGWTLQENLDVPDEFIDKANAIVDKNSLSHIWGWKEPRTTLFLDFWAQLLPDAKFLLIYRSPWDVIDSLYRRGDEIFRNQPELAVKYWIFYNQKVLDFYNKYGDKCLLANIETIVKYQDKYVAEINQKFGINLTNPSPAVYDDSLMQANISEDGQRPSLIDYYFPEAIEMYQELESRGWHPNQTPDLSWNNQIKSSPYMAWAFRDWANYRLSAAENKSLRVELEGTQAKLEETLSQLNPTRDELEETRSQLQETESIVEQFKSQLEQTEGVLEKTHSQLQKTESILQESHNQLTGLRSQFSQVQEELEQAKSQLSQTQWDVMKYQSQLHHTQEELEQAEQQNRELNEYESRLMKTEMMLSQSRLELEQANKTQMRTIAQLHYTQGKLEYSDQYLAELERLEPQLEKTEIQLSQSLLKLNQVEKNHQRTLVQLHQTQGNLETCQLYLAESQQQQTQYKNQLEEWKRLGEESIEQQDEMEKAIAQYQAKLQATEQELESSQHQLQQTQGELQRSQKALNKTELEAEKLRFYKMVANSSSEQSEERKYQLFVWDAWCAYQVGDLGTMAQCLQRSLKYSPKSKTETLSHWLENFSQFAKEKGVPFDTASLTSSEEWKQLMKRAIAVKSLVIPK
ncbi:MAG: sulfotransferase [Limnospira sp. PMC 1291.21]|uniref:sulfotransferase n=2 Tax=Sirenicapillariaceae TaxID=2934961 RepID=UPI00165876F7|nr:MULTISPECIES: sulfotransferase [Limnospira]MDT9176852.1 sulfotransferase [Limnospira sp. PMC 1238.20]MDT9207519.1 sulfotransferase [Limnospira sp. PMC 1252.20]MDT9222523.1 sulfotransferase [Limnospira sp. PMC 1279.21]MDT9227469.1 sulfotransferase [Limnospira sp. PMC 1242.20]MDT9238208.1 sulfotransferase [Limnospira sp. PMC 1261.20]